MIPYEQQLNSSYDWALRQGSLHFDKANFVHKTLRKAAGRLDELGVPYAVAGDLAMFFHGYRRFTEIVVVLVTTDGLSEAHRRLEGPDFIPAAAGSRNLRDAETGVKIEFLVSGEYPGGGKPSPVVLPLPDDSSIIIDG